MLKSTRPGSQSLLLAAVAALLGAALLWPAAAVAQVDLWTDLTELTGDPAGFATTVTYQATYGNMGTVAAVNPYVNIYFPPNVPKPLDQLTVEDVAAITSTISSTMGEPLVFIDSTYCEGIFFQVQCEDDNSRPCPIPGLTAGASGGFTFDLVMPSTLVMSPSFSVTSPQDIVGPWTFRRSGCGATTTACGPGDCFGPRMSQTAAVTTDLELVDDGTGTTGSQGCNALVGFTPGRVAVVDRGSCEFGLKAYNAQNAGAVGTIIVNTDVPSADDTILMGGGVYGPQVTIPVVMITLNQGTLLKTYLPTGVTATFGGVESDVIGWETDVFTNPDEGDSDPSNDYSTETTTLAIFADGFESGNASLWSQYVP